MKTILLTLNLLHDVVFLFLLAVYCLVGGAKKVEDRITKSIWEEKS